ncbi:hypothetical protein OUZ56_026656 [Daphnia magna]|uniref:Uncharacterized protein n=1 Tax=Daphnia magna TaxID=35525 RepID=A0ABQ9ZMG1_9CRUS|nr:hypothetical protein OUZ56_026656 [Daphnia magna]
MRFHMEAKRLKNKVSQKSKEEQHKLRKLSKMVYNTNRNGFRRKQREKQSQATTFPIVDNGMEGML